MSTTAREAAPAAGFKKYYQAPLPAIIAVLIVFGWQGLGHTVMYLMEHRWFPNNVLMVASLLGFVGAWMIYYGRDKSENAATLLGFAGGSLVWLSWIEFSFVWVADALGVQDANWGAKPTKSEYRVMLSSTGVLLASLFFSVIIVGAQTMSRMTGVPVYIVEVIQGLSLMVMLVFALLTEYRVRIGRPGASAALPGAEARA